MRAREAGFTLLEMVVAVGISVILLAAGGYWVLSMRPGALRGALDDFDANLAVAKALAASSGNGATLVFTPRPNAAPGFTLTVYAGRPNVANAVTATNTMIASSPASVSEAHFGNPPFAIFLNSAGYPTGTANYPTLNAQENPTFTVISQQPPCPSGGIELTFTSPQGVTATRTLPCNEPVPIAAGTDPTPTPNAPRISPTYLLAHDTTDSGPLKFKAAEYGYYHWYASTQNGASCQTQSSDTGAAPAVFASPWPYTQASPVSQSSTAPAPPALAPYTWPVGDPNDPPAWFQLSPVLHNGGMCTVTVADDYNQSGTVTVQVMGDLTPSTTSPAAMTVGGAPDTITFTKTFDSQQLLLSAGGPCLGVVTVTTASGAFPSSPSTMPATGTVTVTPIAQGACNLIVQDQYGEQVTLGLTVQQSIASWPQQLVLGGGGGAVGTTSGSSPLAVAHNPFVALGPVINALLDGAVARASASPQPCYALGVTTSYTSGDNASDFVDTSLPETVSAALGIYVDSNGCEVDANDNPIQPSPPAGGISIGMVAYNPTNRSETYNVVAGSTTCNGTQASTTGWYPGSSGVQALLGTEAQGQGQCLVALNDGGTVTTAPDKGLVEVNVMCGPSSVGIGGTCYVIFLNTIPNCISYDVYNGNSTNICANLVAGDPDPHTMYEYMYVPQDEASVGFAEGVSSSETSPNGLCTMPVYGFINASMWVPFAYWADPANVATTTGIPSSTNINVTNSLGLGVSNETEAEFTTTSESGGITANPFVTPPPVPTPFPRSCLTTPPPLP
jgi:prepilin-type N-terminal cleavage/methylation domain-containing protein